MVYSCFCFILAIQSESRWDIHLENILYLLYFVYIILYFVYIRCVLTVIKRIYVVLGISQCSNR